MFADDRVAHAVAALRAARPVLVGGTDRESKYEVVLPAALAEPRWTAWMVRHTSGILCAPLPAERAGALGLPPMVQDNQDPRSPVFTVSVDAADGITTGISATDRARTARVLADPASGPADLVRPGHLLPLRVCANGVVVRPGHAEAGVDLCRLAGLPPVALTARLVGDGVGMAGDEDAALLAARHDLPVLHIPELVEHRLRFGDGERGRVTRVTNARLPTEHGPLDAVGYRDEVTGAEHVALVGRPWTGVPLVAVHAECITGDTFKTTICDCARRFAESAAIIAHAGGVLVYLRRPGARVLDGHIWTTADDGAAGAIVADLGFRSVRLLTGPAAAPQLARPGLTVLAVQNRAASLAWSNFG
ncbi:3,4-dihydroxy-2-butanone-4-phosphate synthase [Amycolatopsis methanolica]|uniref:3,4-dihydroxy-2-butanone-4-phosphate synthase n=1 Tax=Amycolatopsis methanolica 239 TaxID=1068978 RepID=A0A076MUW8_AMYME|nr:3,4-dihydroxy-2-butanone-4-phosphate synthase [Amycolatopsis methanolica]AIJ22505.1 3,4-dihydroxy-2-butanone 4-phosphate synthase [Amycolatopsis methanolica 239]